MAKSRTLGDDIPLAFRPYIRSILSGNAIKPPEAPEADWNALLERLRNHRIIPLLSYLISSLPEALRPPRNIRRTMHKAFAASHLRDMHMDRQLQPIVAAFAERGIELIVLKGPALAHSVYPHPATRPYADLDLLVKWSQMDDAHAALLDLGYVSEGRRFASPLRNVIGQDEYRPGGQLQASRTVELHWGLSAFPREQPDLFARSVQLDFS